MKRFLSVEQVVTLNKRLIREFGGIYGIRDVAGLEAAVARPQSGYDEDIIEEAAGLFESLSQNHPFLDGNKRTAIAATAIFLLMNGFEMQIEDRKTYLWLIELYESGHVNKSAIAFWLRENAIRIKPR